MAATAWTVQKSNISSGLSPTNQAIDSTNGNKFRNNGKVRVRIKGNAGATGQIEFQSKICSQGRSHSIKSIAGDHDALDREYGPFPTEIFNNPDGDVVVIYTGTLTGITANVIENA